MAAKNILIVEDESVIRNLCLRILGGYKYKLNFTANIQEALQMIRKTDHFDMLISDLKLPDGDGTTVIRSFKERFKSSPILVMTGSLSPEQRMGQVKDLGVVDIIFKPFDISVFEAAIIKALGPQPS